MSLALLNDGQIIDKIAKGYRKKRLLLNMTQESLAKRANISINTVKKFERGEASSFKTLISILRALGEIDRVQTLILENQESPEEIFMREKLSKKIRQRASSERDQSS